MDKIRFLILSLGITLASEAQIANYTYVPKELIGPCEPVFQKDELCSLAWGETLSRLDVHRLNLETGDLQTNRFRFNPSTPKRHRADIRLAAFDFSKGSLVILTNLGVYLAKDTSAWLEPVDLQADAFMYDHIYLSDNELTLTRTRKMVRNQTWLLSLTVDLRTGDTVNFFSPDEPEGSIFSNMPQYTALDPGIYVHRYKPVVEDYLNNTTIDLTSEIPPCKFINPAVRDYLEGYPQERPYEFMDTTLKAQALYYTGLRCRRFSNGDFLLIASLGTETGEIPDFLMVHGCLENKTKADVRVFETKRLNAEDTIRHPLQVESLFNLAGTHIHKGAYFFLLRMGINTRIEGITFGQYAAERYARQFEDGGMALIRLEADSQLFKY